MKNKIIRIEAQERKVCLWQIAEKLGIAEATFSRKLRRELPDDEQEHILEIIEQIAAEQRA